MSLEQPEEDMNSSREERPLDSNPSLSYQEMEVLGTKLSLFLAILLCIAGTVSALSFYYSQPVRAFYETLSAHEETEKHILEGCLPYCSMEALQSLQSINTPLVLSAAYLSAYDDSLRSIYTTLKDPSMRTAPRGGAVFSANSSSDIVYPQPPGYSAILAEMQHYPEYASNALMISTLLLTRAEQNTIQGIQTLSALCDESGPLTIQCRQERGEVLLKLDNIRRRIELQKARQASVERYTVSPSAS